ncbi:hypothetical protein GCM10027570_13540 [Streptomonospora sediminis]
MSPSPRAGSRRGFPLRRGFGRLRGLARLLPRRPHSRLRTAGVCVLLLVLLTGIRALIVGPSDITDPIAYSGKAPEPVDAERFTAEVRGVGFARALTEAPDDEDGEAEEEGEPVPLPAGNVWLLVEVRLTAATRTVNVQAPILLESGSGPSYAASGELTPLLSGGGGFSSEELHPGIPVSGVIAFDVPVEHITDPRLRIRAGLPRMDRLTGLAVIDLGMTADEVAKGARNATATAVVPETREGTGPGVQVRPAEATAGAGDD